MGELGLGDRRIITGCVRFRSLFQDPLLDEPPAANSPAAQRRRYREMVTRAGAICARCPVQVDCLYEAVVRQDVSGFVAGTTQRQRTEIRRRLDVRVEQEDLDAFTVSPGPRRLDPEAVLRTRAANPHETLESIARRLGCSLSTVKRHLRRARAAEQGGGPGTASAPAAPSAARVLAVTAEVVTGGARSLRRVA